MRECTASWQPIQQEVTQPPSLWMFKVCFSAIGSNERHLSNCLSCAVPPVIIDGPSEMKRLSGENVTFTCTVQAEPVHPLQWLFNGELIQPSATHIMTTMGETQGNLTIVNISLADAGNYTCFAENVHGNASASEMLLVQGIVSKFVFHFVLLAKFHQFFVCLCSTAYDCTRSFISITERFGWRLIQCIMCCLWLSSTHFQLVSQPSGVAIGLCIGYCRW